MRAILSIGLLALPLAGTTALAHGGGLAADGCHNDRKNGGRHCHRGPGASFNKSANQPMRNKVGSVYYANCTAASAAGAAPVRRGEPGCASHLDRDNDGVGCE